MTNHEKIARLLSSIWDGFESIEHNYCIIGSGALALAGFDTTVNDLDILTTRSSALQLKDLWKSFADTGYRPGNPDRFRSEFGRFAFPGMAAEVMGDLEVNHGGAWRSIRVETPQIVILKGKSLRIPNLEDQKRIFLAFGRQKDLEKAALIANNN